tara:strand:+ start:4199 stop:4459 length:261 start_codon:yes stop_codon:yes gene_type:complete
MMNPFRIVWELIEFAIQALFVYILAIILVVGVLIYTIMNLENKAEKIIYRDRIIDNTVVPEDIIKTEPECTRLDGCRVLEDGTIEY